MLKKLIDRTNCLARDFEEFKSSGSGGEAVTDASKLTTGTLSNDRLSSSVTKNTENQTLTNKTISGTNNTLTDIPQTSVIGLDTSLSSKASLNSPTFTGNIVLPSTTVIGNVDATELSYVNGVTSPIQTQLTGKEPTINPGTTAQYWRGDKTWQTLPTGGSATTNAAELTSGKLNNARLNTEVMLSTKLHWFNVLDYGALGDGSTDDAPAFQAAINAARIVKGTIIVPAPNIFYRINSQLNIVPILFGQPGYVSGNEVYLNIIAYGGSFQDQIRYTGPSNSSCFYIKGLRYSKIDGLKIKIVDGATSADRQNVQAFDLDTDNPSFSTAQISFNDCYVWLGNGLDNVGWRMGHVSGGGADISNLQWNNCNVWGNYGLIIAGQIGWLIEGANTLQNVWNGGFGAYLDRLFSNKNRPDAGNPPGNGGCYFIGLGTSHNNIEYEINNSQSYTVFGGRYEVGKHFLVVTNSSDSPNIVVMGAELNDFNPDDGSSYNESLFWIDRPCSLILSGVNILKDSKPTPYTNKMILLYGGGAGLYTGTLAVTGGTFDAADPFYLKGNSTPWKVYVNGVGKGNAGQRTTMMKDKYPYTSPNGTQYHIEISNTGEVSTILA